MGAIEASFRAIGPGNRSASVDRIGLAEEGVEEVVGDAVVLLLEAGVGDAGHHRERPTRVRGDAGYPGGAAIRAQKTSRVLRKRKSAVSLGEAATAASPAARIAWG